ncbi:hypothetical protein PHLCEN_2v11611 [Hermanssonia centrifuga]|uniref:CBM1 domain-containing protein n=1 Tax=Hermanssonia centrifuga TaxID=98765 RepID=A0A2R6NJM7_9APHY|nr:hypothetical protein PHLCEN_2v11611 [Hermanssonia centrifuga]
MQYLTALVALATVLAVPANAVAVWGQCGGTGYSGSTVCDAGSVCTYSNAYYSQCLPGTATSAPASAPPTSAPPTSTGAAPPSSATGLDAKFKAKGKLFWATASDSNRFSDATDSAVTIAQFGGVTPENSMKWDAVGLHTDSESSEPRILRIETILYRLKVGLLNHE